MNADLSPYLSGLGLGASLIIAIGAQNAFVLVQGIKRNHHMPVAALCAFIDAALISLGVLGVGSVVASSITLRTLAALGGGLFLFWFGLRSLREAFTDRSLELDNSPDASRGGLKKTLMATLAVSILNPHVYLDTVIMLGSISASYSGQGRYLFGAGACTASIVWFFSLALCGRVLAPLFARPAAWRALSALVCLTVWMIAASLFYEVWKTRGEWLSIL